ncbi:MAG: SMP-30/gluconolactonase/LRE family protein [Sphingorhabdus sp.]
MAHIKTLVAGLTFPEGLRWHEGRLWFSDFYSHAVYAVGLSGNCEKIVDVPGQPSGLGWLPDGDLLVVSMVDQKVMRLHRGTLSVHADLSPFARFHCNDMLVTAGGRAYVGNFGFDPHCEDPQNTTLIAVDPDGRAHVVADEMAFPNGMALTDGGQTLVVAESARQCLTAFDIAEGGALSNRRLFAQLNGCQPDGIAGAANGDIWVTTMTCNRLVRFCAEGVQQEVLELDHPCWSCALGGPDGETLFVATADHYVGDICQRERSGAVGMWA